MSTSTLPDARAKRPGASARRWTWIDAASIAGVLAVALAVLIYFRREPVFSDDFSYWERWRQITRTRGQANPYRLTMVLSAELAKLVFGESMAAYNAVGIAYSAGLIVVLYLLGHLLFSRVAGFAAAAMLLSSPLFLQDATLLLPDWPAMFWFCLAVLLMAWAVLLPDERRRDRLVASAAAGVALYLMVLAKEGAVPILLAVPIGLLLLAPERRRAWRVLGTALIPFSVLAVAELIMNWIVYDHPFRRIMVVLGGHVARRTSERLGGQVPTASSNGGSGGGGGDSLTWGDLATRYLDPILALRSGQWMVGLAIVAGVILLVSRSRRLWYVAVPAIIGMGFVVFGVGSINPLRPLLSMKFRYLSAGWVFVPLVIAGALWIAGRWIGPRLPGARGRKDAAGTIVASVLVVGLISPAVVFAAQETASQSLFVRAGSDGLQQTENAIEALMAEGAPINRIVADGRTIQGLRIQLDGDEQGLLERSSSNFASAAPGDLVVVNRKRLGEAGLPYRGDPLPEWLLIPPTNWREVGAAAHTDMFAYYVEDDAGAFQPDVGTTGSNVTDLVRGTQLDGEDVEFGWQRGPNGVLIWMQDIDRAQIVTGIGFHAQPPREHEAPQLSIDDSGRLGVRIDLHVDRGIELPSLWLRVFGADGEQTQLLRLYRLEDDGRTPEPGFAVDMERMRNVSFAGSIEVDAAVDKTFRVVVFASGTGVVTADRVMVGVYPTR